MTFRPSTSSRALIVTALMGSWRQLNPTAKRLMYLLCLSVDCTIAVAAHLPVCSVKISAASMTFPSLWSRKVKVARMSASEQYTAARAKANV